MDDRQKARITGLLQAARERSALDETSAFNLLSALRLERYETRTHSRIIFFLLNSRCGQNESFLHLFLQAIRIPERFLHEQWSVSREKPFGGGSDRVDFVLESKSFCAVVEMKIDAGDGDRQLTRYASGCRRKGKDYAVYYLTLDGHKPDERSARGLEPGRLRCVSFDRELVQWLQKCMDSVEKDSYPYSFLQQYLGAVRQAAGMDGEGAGVKELLDSSDMARAAQAVANGFHEKMNDMTELFFEKLCMEIRSRTGLEALPYTKCADIFLETVPKGNRTFRIVVALDIDTFLYAGFGFCEEAGDGSFPLIPLADAEAAIPSIYRKWMQKLNALENSVEFCQTKWEKWFYLEDAEGARLNFKDHTAQIRLIDEMDRQCKYISDSLVNGLIRPLCHL